METMTPIFQGERLRDLLFCYAGPWAFKPYLRNRDDEEILWHARQGVLLAFTEITITLFLMIFGLLPVFGILARGVLLPIWLLWCLGMSVTSILQATKGKRHRIPVLHQFIEYL